MFLFVLTSRKQETLRTYTASHAWNRISFLNPDEYQPEDNKRQLCASDPPMFRMRKAAQANTRYFYFYHPAISTAPGLCFTISSKIERILKRISHVPRHPQPQSLSLFSASFRIRVSNSASSPQVYISFIRERHFTAVSMIKELFPDVLVCIQLSLSAPHNGKITSYLKIWRNE